MSLRTALNVVLHQTRSPDNLGAVTRLMANFGFQRLTLSDKGPFALQEAEKMAIKGEALALLSSLRMEDSLPPAVADCVYAVGTSMRTLDGRPPLTPEQAVERLVEHSARGPVALVFGGEKRGLNDAELAYCQDVCGIPTQPAQPSMNLAQSAAVLLYLCSRADRIVPAPVEPEAAHLRTVQAMEVRMKEVLLASGFLNAQQPELILRELVYSLSRARLSKREAELWVAAFKQLGRGRFD
ncbi:MAG: RNA methyltransferase [Myxococcota bacterium]|nr:RNA methyltransferase [Myxococcota bacterium]